MTGGNVGPEAKKGWLVANVPPHEIGIDCDVRRVRTDHRQPDRLGLSCTVAWSVSALSLVVRPRNWDEVSWRGGF
jgi:hypothetical protein